jgi:hypothetical protein
LIALDNATSRLWFDASETALTLDGIVLEAQFDCDAGFLLLITYDVPYEEILNIYLVSPDLRVLDEENLGCFYTPGLLRDLTGTAEDCLSFSFFGGDRWSLTVLTQPTALRRRLLVLRRVVP